MPYKSKVKPFTPFTKMGKRYKGFTSLFLLYHFGHLFGLHVGIAHRDAARYYTRKLVESSLGDLLIA
jgi:hypothetical protein